MRINKLVLENVGLYHGRTTLDFGDPPGRHTPHKKQKNIILLGGLNGAGKTTLFDAVVFCLYGRDMFPRISTAAYQDYLSQKIHRSRSLPVQPNHASVGLEFDHSHLGEVSTYSIERRWEIKGKKVLEYVTINKNGEPPANIGEDGLQDFIKELIPVGLSQLFFFNGEKIQKIMEDNNNHEFKHSVKMLLGLDIIDRLEADLDIYRSRKLKEVSTGKHRDEIESLERQTRELEGKRNKKMTALANLKNKIDRLEAEIARYREKMTAQGSDYLVQKDRLKQDKSNQERDLEQVREKIRELAAGALPLALAPGRLAKLKGRVQEEKNQQTERAARERLRAKQGELVKNITAHELLAASDPMVKERLEAILKHEMDRLFEADEGAEVEEIFGLSRAQADRLVLVIDGALRDVPQRITQLTTEFEQHFRAIQRLAADLKRVPDEDLLKPMHEKLEELNRQLGGLLNEKQHLEDETSVLDRELDEVRVKIARTHQLIDADRQTGTRLNLVADACKVLGIYRQKLLAQKIEVLKREFLLIFGELHRKKDLVSSIRIDPDRLELELYDKNGARIARESLSDGEKEIYAISLLSALGRASGQNLPFIIDMPLGRLDTVHRDHVVERFFPHASHQVIILSTNTEIGREYFERLKPNILRTYSLDYNHDDKQTRVKEGYFWN